MGASLSWGKLWCDGQVVGEEVGWGGKAEVVRGDRQGVDRWPGVGAGVRG